MPSGVCKWRDGGRWASTRSGSVFVRSAEGVGPTVLLLHGYPSSSYDYRMVVPQLAGRAWLTLDFLGFGLSDKPRPHRSPPQAGGAPSARAGARLSSKAMFGREFARVFSANHPLSAQEAEAQWALMSYNGGHRIAHLLISYLDERERYAERWHGAVRDWPKPLSFLWALDDPVATTNVLDGLRELRPAADVVELPGVGHYPQGGGAGRVYPRSTEPAVNGPLTPTNPGTV